MRVCESGRRDILVLLQYSSWVEVRLVASCASGGTLSVRRRRQRKRKRKWPQHSEPRTEASTVHGWPTLLVDLFHCILVLVTARCAASLQLKRRNRRKQTQSTETATERQTQIHLHAALSNYRCLPPPLSSLVLHSLQWLYAACRVWCSRTACNAQYTNH